MKLNKVQQNQLSSGIIKSGDFHQKRITNAAPAQNLNDYVVLQQLSMSIITTTEADFVSKAQVNRLYIFNDTDDGLRYVAFFDGTDIQFLYTF